MGELKFSRPPERKRTSAQLLLTVGALVIAAAAFLLGRLSVHPMAPAAVPAEPRPSEPAAPRLPTAQPAAAAAPAEPTIPFLRPSPVGVPGSSPAAPAAPASSSQVFALPTSAPFVPTEEPAATPTQYAEMARCLSFSVSRDDSISMTYGVRVRVEARNSCGVAFPGSDVQFEVRAYPLGGGGLAARESGSFQSTIPARGTAETLVHVRCDADRSFRFEARIARS